MRQRLLAGLCAGSAALAAATATPAHASQVGSVSGANAGQPAKGLTGTSADARADLSKLTVHAAGSMSGCDRHLSPHWRDASTNGWPVQPDGDRNAALYRDGDDVTMPASGTSLKGTWIDPYGEGEYASTADIDIDIDIEVRVNAWSRGDGVGRRPAHDVRQRPAGAGLVQGQHQPGRGRPRSLGVEVAEHRLLLPLRHPLVLVKDEYDLWVTSTEKEALNTMLATC